MGMQKETDETSKLRRQKKWKRKKENQGNVCQNWGEALRVIRQPKLVPQPRSGILSKISDKGVVRIGSR